MANAEKRPLKVFLCHASGDKPPVRDLYKHLVAEGVDAWLDKEKLLPGQDWRLEIPRAVQEADVVVVCLSNKSVTKEGYVQKEIKFALDSAEEKPEGTIFLIPARLEDCVVPERLSRWQWVDLYEENGFIQLLRSLKLRADAVGATVEPTAYEDSDKEVGRRLDQLYTEGLAAFYTEDWDRACHRFQSILNERPSHKIATEKLAAAERQRNLAKLYGQSAEAYKSENWQMAIKTLEELSQKSADYKDAAQLLKNARKQKQLKELYAEAKTLHAAQKWQAVVKVFEQISIIDSTYPDPDGLLPSAQREVAELKRLSDLNDLYSHAVREMDAGQWYEARQLLEQVHKTQTGFLETERLLRKVEDEITKVEEHNQRNNQVNVLYEQAHGLLRSKKWRKALDKMEEIQGLDEQFLDKDEISEKAKIELAREEQEAKRQNELAAMYAEAVRLLDDEKYQEALGKWQEVKAIDPKYPDRQWVQRTAKKKLAGVAKPIQIKARFVTPKFLWIGILGLIILGVIVTGITLSRKQSQTVLPSSTSVLTDNVLIIATRPTMPIQTRTPRPATSAPTNNALAISTRPTMPAQAGTPRPATSHYADPTMYDDFGRKTFDGKYNDTLWEFFSGDPNAKIIQNNGVLKIDSSGYNQGAGLGMKNITGQSISSPFFWEASVRLEPNQNGGIGIFYGIDQGGGFCQIWAMNQSQDIGCYQKFVQKEESTKTIKIDQGTWHILRIEITPGPQVEIVYLIDGVVIGNYPISISAKTINIQYLSIQSNCNGDGCIDKNQRTLTGYFDYVRMGAIEDDPNTLLYEDFDNPTFNGSYDKSMWETCRGSDPNGKVIQNNGALSMAQAGTTSGNSQTNLCARKYENANLSGVISFEADLMFPNLQIGQVRIGLVNNIGGAGCLHHYSYNINDYFSVFHCDYFSPTRHWVSNVKDVKPGTWHSARIELDTSTGKLIYYLDGQKNDTYDTGSELNQTGYWFVLTIMAESKNDVIGYIDNVRIRRIEK